MFLGLLESDWIQHLVIALAVITKSDHPLEGTDVRGEITKFEA